MSRRRRYKQMQRQRAEVPCCQDFDLQALCHQDFADHFCEARASQAIQRVGGRGVPHSTERFPESELAHAGCSTCASKVFLHEISTALWDKACSEARSVVQLSFLHCGVILSVAVFQAERRISRLTGFARKPSCNTTETRDLELRDPLRVYTCCRLRTAPSKSFAKVSEDKQ